MKWSIYVGVKALLAMVYGIFIGLWSVDAIDPIAIGFRIIVMAIGLIWVSVILGWIEDGINLRKKLE